MFKIPCLSINARPQLQDRSISSSSLYNGCWLHYHTTDSVLTSGYFFNSQCIWIKIFIVLVILGRCRNIEIFSTSKSCIEIQISGWQIDDLGTLTSANVTGYGGWCRLCSWLSASLGWRCTCAFASPACMRILGGANVAWKVFEGVVLPKHSRVSFYCSLHLFMSK
jgi:hypothetical protein